MDKLEFLNMSCLPLIHVCWGSYFRISATLIVAEVKPNSSCFHWDALFSCHGQLRLLKKRAEREFFIYQDLIKFRVLN